jgi:hypothetical protein
MPVDPVSDSAFLRQPKTRKSGNPSDKTGKQKDFENENTLNKILGDDNKRAFLKKSPDKEPSPQKTDMSINQAPTDRKGKYIDEIV